MGGLYKYKSAISTSMCPTRDLYKSTISTSMHIILLYEFKKDYDICYCYMLTVNEYKCMCIGISHMFPTKRKA